MGTVGNNHFVACEVSVMVMVGMNHHKAGKLAVSTGKRIQGEFGHAANFAEE